jgi:hypothetical protein
VKIKTAGAVLFAAACVIGLAAATAPPAHRTKPTIDYSVATPCGGSFCTINDAIAANPSAYNVRARLECSDLSFHYGNWKVSGTTSAGCGSGHGHGILGGYQYDKTHKYTVACWVPSDPRSGTC